MARTLDAATQATAAIVISVIIAIILLAECFASAILARKRAGAVRAEVSKSKGSSLLLGCAWTTGLVALCTAVLLAPLMGRGPHGEKVANQVTSSINFCEDDFVHSTAVAEPVNTVTSLTGYALLAVLGLVAQAKAREGGSYPSSIFFMYAALLAIGIGSASLHALLTAAAQGGDELPMLWLVAATANCGIGICLREAGSAAADSVWLPRAFMITAAMASAVYVLKREDFVIFLIMFALYAICTILPLIWIVIVNDLSKKHGEEGDDASVHVIMPLGIAAGWFAIFAMLCWIFEMTMCEAVVDRQVLGPMIFPGLWKNVLHGLWHFCTAVAAFFIIQILVAMHGLQHAWGRPYIRWFGVPCVAYLPHSD